MGITRKIPNTLDEESYHGCDNDFSDSNSESSFTNISISDEITAQDYVVEGFYFSSIDDMRQRDNVDKNFSSDKIVIDSKISKIKKYQGQRKSRRLANTQYLLKIGCNEIQVDDIPKSLFSQIINKLPEEKSNEFLNGKNDDKIYARQKRTRNVDYSKANIADNAFLRLSASQKLLLQEKAALGMISFFDNKVVSFFKKWPESTYDSGEVTSFERLIYHSLANYYSLKAKSIAVNAKVKIIHMWNAEKKLKINNPLLCDYLKRFL